MAGIIWSFKLFSFVFAINKSGLKIFSLLMMALFFKSSKITLCVIPSLQHAKIAIVVSDNSQRQPASTKSKLLVL